MNIVELVMNDHKGFEDDSGAHFHAEILGVGEIPRFSVRKDFTDINHILMEYG